MPRLVGDIVTPGTVGSTEQPSLPIDDELELRPFRIDDIDAVVAAFATPDIQYFHFRQLDRNEARAWIEESHIGWTSEKAATWAVALGPDRHAVGRITVYMSLAEGRGEVSYWVLPEARQRRIATRACVTATRWAHGLGIHRIELQHSTKNDGSRRVAISAGFRPEGVQREASFLADGWHDMMLYSHLATDEP